MADVAVYVNFNRPARYPGNCECLTTERIRLSEISIPVENPVARYHYGCGRCGHYWTEDVRDAIGLAERTTDTEEASDADA